MQRRRATVEEAEMGDLHLLYIPSLPVHLRCHCPRSILTLKLKPTGAMRRADEVSRLEQWLLLKGASSSCAKLQQDGEGW